MQWALIGREKPGVSSSHGSLIYLVSLGHGASLCWLPHNLSILKPFLAHTKGKYFVSIINARDWAYKGECILVLISWAAQYSLGQRGININSVLSIMVITVMFLKGLPQIYIILYSHLPSFSFLHLPVPLTSLTALWPLADLSSCPFLVLIC